MIQDLIIIAFIGLIGVQVIDTLINIYKKIKK